jgi:hypothetical protein
MEKKQVLSKPPNHYSQKSEVIKNFVLNGLFLVCTWKHMETFLYEKF